MDIDSFYKKIARRIKYLRKERGLTQEKLAELANISVDYLGKIETNLNKPGLIALYKIVNNLDISFENFFKGFDYD